MSLNAFQILVIFFFAKKSSQNYRMMISGPKNRHYDSAYILGPEIFILRWFLAPKIVQIAQKTSLWPREPISPIQTVPGVGVDKEEDSGLTREELQEQEKLRYECL